MSRQLLSFAEDGVPNALCNSFFLSNANVAFDRGILVTVALDRRSAVSASSLMLDDFGCVMLPNEWMGLLS